MKDLKKTMLWAGPLVALSIIVFTDLSPGNPEVSAMAGIVVLMALWWLTEAIPLAATALLPVVLYPLLGVMPGREAASLYFNHIIFLFIGGFMIALAMERWNLHKRIALNVIHWIGLTPNRMILGFMLAGGFLSMWMSNTATTMMMVPIALAVIMQLEAQENTPEVQRFGVGLLLSIAYACSIGGISTIIGTPPNVAFVSIYEQIFPQAPEISFAGWMIFALPIAVIMIASTWFVITRLFCKNVCKRDDGCMADVSVFDTEREKLGAMTQEEKTVMILFVTTAFLWMSRSDINFGSVTLPGWGNFFNGLTDDGTVAMMMASLLFILPSKQSETGRLMRWEDMKDLPWGIVLLFGGGFAMAGGMQDSGLSMVLAQKLTALDQLPITALVAVCSGFMTFLTEFTTNIASVQMVLPILSSIAVTLKVNPLLLMIPVTVSSSFAFMLPVATAPNAIIFGSNRIKIMDMCKTGIYLNLIGILVTVILMLTIGQWVFQIDPTVIPDWAVTSQTP